MTDADDIEMRRLAVRRADMKLAFRSHLMAYVGVNGGLVALNLITSPGYFWAIWPMPSSKKEPRSSLSLP